MTSNLPNIPSTPPSSYLASRLAQAQGKPLPAGEAIASFVRHDDALAAFDVLSEQDYPVTALYLVNDGIRQVEYPVQPGYGRALISAAIQGASMGLVFSVLLTLTGDSFTSVALRYVPLSVAVFVLWQMYILRRNRGIRYPMRTEAIPLAYRDVRSAGVRSGCTPRAGCAPSLLGGGCGCAGGGGPGGFAGAGGSEYRFDEWCTGSDRCAEGTLVPCASG